jgi:hypothetical protein
MRTANWIARWPKATDALQCHRVPARAPLFRRELTV